MAAVPTSRQMAVFATRHEFDAATQLFSSEVAEPLASGAVGQRQKFSLRPFIGDAATKNGLDKILRGDIDGGAPAVLFSGSHGKSFRPDDPRQPGSQGALICQDCSVYGKVERDAHFDASARPAHPTGRGLRS